MLATAEPLRPGVPGAVPGDPERAADRLSRARHRLAQATALGYPRWPRCDLQPLPPGAKIHEDSGAKRLDDTQQGDSEGPNLHQLHSTAITKTHLRSPGSSARGTPTRTRSGTKTNNAWSPTPKSPRRLPPGVKPTTSAPG